MLASFNFLSFVYREVGVLFATLIVAEGVASYWFIGDCLC